MGANRLLKSEAPAVRAEQVAGVGDPAVGVAASVAADAVPEGNIDKVLGWVGSDKDRAQRALDKENEAEEPRSSLVERLTHVAGA